MAITLGLYATNDARNFGVLLSCQRLRGFLLSLAPPGPNRK